MATWASSLDSELDGVMGTAERCLPPVHPCDPPKELLSEAELRGLRKGRSGSRRLLRLQIDFQVTRHG